MKPLSTSQVKQIAGRAGRYGLLHSSSPESEHSTPDASSPGGFVTALYQPDLPFIGQALSAPIQPLCYARLGIRLETFTALIHALPARASTFTVFEAHVYIGCIGDNYRYAMPSHEELEAMCELVDRQSQSRGPTDGKAMEFHRRELEKTHPWRDWTIEERSLLCLAPVPWRDRQFLMIMRRFVEMYRQSLQVDLSAAIQGQGFMEAVEGMESHEAASDWRKKSSKRPLKQGTEEIGKFNQPTLILLETFHKIIALYIWMSYRNPASWVKRDEVIKLKLRVERALERCLEGLSREVVDYSIFDVPQVEESGGKWRRARPSQGFAGAE